MRTRTPFGLATTGDLILRAAYQMGKTPLLPIFAAQVGAGDVLLGLIVSVSTMTGIVLKPLVGALSDCRGRRRWILGGAVIFVVMPLLYRFVQTPTQLVTLRLLHGMATAIYGPVSLAYVAQHARHHRGLTLGLFGMGRSGGYIVGPLAAGWLLQTHSPVAVFTIIGLLSALAMLPLAVLPASATVPMRLRSSPRAALARGFRSRSAWLAGGIEAGLSVVVYAVKAFLPLHAIAQGSTLLAVGMYFSVQELTLLLLQPIGGWFGDRTTRRHSIAGGLAVLGLAVAWLSSTPEGYALLGPAVLTGLAQALVKPSARALVADRVDAKALGASLGFAGALRNVGKVSGPLLAGGLVMAAGHAVAFQVLGTLSCLAALAIVLVPVPSAAVPPRPRFQTELRGAELAIAHVPRGGPASAVTSR